MGRNTIGAAKSLHVKRNPTNLKEETDPKYNWLFNDDETPRDRDGDHESGANYRSYKYKMSPEKQKAYNDHFAVEVMKSGKSTAIE